jgi:hypothetical protein
MALLHQSVLSRQLPVAVALEVELLGHFLEVQAVAEVPRA